MTFNSCLQEAVITNLRLLNIKPHWIFALDSLVRDSVQAGITVLSPKIGAHLQPSDNNITELVQN